MSTMRLVGSNVVYVLATPDFDRLSQHNRRRSLQREQEEAARKAEHADAPPRRQRRSAFQAASAGTRSG